MTRRWLALVSLLLLASCSDDPVQPPPPPTASVVVTELATGDAVPGVKIVAMNAVDNTVLAGPLLTDASGRIAFGFAPDPQTRYLVLGGLDWNVHHQSDWVSAQAINHIILRRAIPHDGLPRIAGLVVDAVTGAPLAQAFIGVAPQLLAYNGETDPGADVTGPDGAFLVQEIAFAPNPVTGNLRQIDLLFVSRAGYRPRSWVYQHANGDNNLDITGTRIALTPMNPADTGLLSGRVLLNGLPVADVPVGLGGASTAKSGFGLPGQVAHTDQFGRFTFSGLATGFYVLHPGFGLRDGFVPAGQAGFPSLTVVAGETTEAGDQPIMREIVPILGANASVTREIGSLQLSWSAVTEAFAYLVTIDGVTVQTTVQNQLVWEIPAEMPAGSHRWRVAAETESHNLVGAMQKDSPWRLLAE